MRQGLPLRLEAGEHRLGVHPRLDDLHRHRPLDRLGLLGHEDAAHAAGADLLDQLVLAREDGADAGGRIGVVLRFLRGRVLDGFVRPLAALFQPNQQSVGHLGVGLGEPPA